MNTDPKIGWTCTGIPTNSYCTILSTFLFKRSHFQDAHPDLVNHVFQENLHFISPHRDQFGRRVIIYRSGVMDPDIISFNEVYCVGYMLSELMGVEQKTQIAGELKLKKKVDQNPSWFETLFAFSSIPIRRDLHRRRRRVRLEAADLLWNRRCQKWGAIRPGRTNIMHCVNTAIGIFSYSKTAKCLVPSGNEETLTYLSMHEITIVWKLAEDFAIEGTQNLSSHFSELCCRLHFFCRRASPCSSVPSTWWTPPGCSTCATRPSSPSSAMPSEIRSSSTAHSRVYTNTSALKFCPRWGGKFAFENSKHLILRLQRSQQFT